MAVVASPGVWEGCNWCQKMRPEGVNSRGQLKAPNRNSTYGRRVPLQGGGPAVPEAFRKDLQRTLRVGRPWMLEGIWRGGTVYRHMDKCLEETGRSVFRANENWTKCLLTVRLTPYTAQVWTVWVHLHTDIFSSKYYIQDCTVHDWLNSRIPGKHRYQGLTLYD